MKPIAIKPYWEHFEHEADVGVRGIAMTLEQAFGQAALAMTAAVTDPDGVSSDQAVEVACEAPDVELLLVSWLNELIYRMAVQGLIFKSFQIEIKEGHLSAKAFGEAVDPKKHQPAVEIKGATFTELRVYQRADGAWVAQCVVDV